ncbi:hypothetical protein D3C81_1228330 [compost metagenome]
MGNHLAHGNEVLEALWSPIHVELLKQCQHGFRLQLQGPVAVAGAFTHKHGQLLAFTRRLEALVERLDRGWLQAMQQAGPANVQWLMMFGCLRQCRQRSRISLKLRHQLFQCRAVAQHVDEHLRLVFHQRSLDLFPAAFSRQRLQFARSRDLLHQLQCFIGDPEPQRRIACGKAGNTQYAQGVFGECRGHVA